VAERGFRLSTRVRPLTYEVAVDVRPPRRSYRGRVSIRARLERATRNVVLHAADLRITSARAETERGVQRARVALQPERETATLAFDRALPSGECTLELRFSGQLRSDLRGLYAAGADGRHYAFTQLEAADARRFFPCFDEPAMKARFTLEVSTDAENQVISNAPVATQSQNASTKHVQFRSTPPLSTYLLALAVGPLEASRATRLGATPIRVWSVPGRGGLSAFALETARECLARLERYFALPYPYEKLDLVAVPDFEAGAMENAGAVFFRETLLLIDRATATPAEKKRAAEVICHELAHMWYGDLVTMAWWDDLWLNEAFATWMAFAIVDDWKPDWKMWHDFQHHRAAALRLDSLRHTHPIHTPVRSPAEATANFDLITYEKGASVVRMIERYLGGRAFRSGVRRYIRRHREGNAVAADLWNALSEAAGEEVAPLVRPWIEREGFPAVVLGRDRSGALVAEQRRFRAAPSSGRSARREAPWPIPWIGRTGRREVRHRFARRRARIPLPEDAAHFLYGNALEAGFYRPLHREPLFEALRANLARLRPVERMGLVDHEWALARAGAVGLDRFLSLVGELGAESDPDVLTALRAPLAFLEDQIARPASDRLRQRLCDRLVETFGPSFLELGWEAARGEPEAVRERRAATIEILGLVAAWPPIEAAAVPRFEAYLEKPRSLDPHLADAVVELAARTGDSDRFDQLLAAFDAAETPQHRRRFLFALAAFRKPALIGRVERLCLGARVPTQDVAFVLARLLGNPEARLSAWSFITHEWDRLARRIPPMLATRLIEATPSLGSLALAQEVRHFFVAHPLPAGRRSLDQALERFRLDARFRRAAMAPLRRWLGA